MRYLIIFAAAWLTVMVPCAAAPVRATHICTPIAGDRVVLIADANDPDVFMWDARANLINYATGHLRGAPWVLAHTILVNAGTPAFVVSCFSEMVRERYGYGIGSEIHDAIGVKLTGGPFQGRFGWVTSSDTLNLHAQR
ncbi:MAG TPA: hypothetical protein VGZ00_00075 [Candidatus Baltobacteraceae bacterium]|jgi:hypothetical protein|nr:hypothetical protein [Candidatus Baltobacteraceae bacterium]